MDRRQKIFHELLQFSDHHFEGREYFVCIYGSYASLDQKETSDLDLFIAVKQILNEDLLTVIGYVKRLHARYALTIDDEVPYENKFLVTYADLESAINLEAFKKDSSKYHIPPIVKDNTFLSSREVRWRLLLNALTSPHVYIGGNLYTYTAYKIRAEEGIILLVRRISGRDAMSADEILDFLLKGNSGDTGEMHLGYNADRTVVVNHLKDIIKRQLSE